jgi:hypothetical protein
MAFRKSPEEGVGECVFTEVAKDFIVDLEGSEVS